jgi:hypothetical protein
MPARRADQDCFFILESLARELILVARLKRKALKSQGNRYIRNRKARDVV